MYRIQKCLYLIIITSKINKYTQGGCLSYETIPSGCEIDFIFLRVKINNVLDNFYVRCRAVLEQFVIFIEYPHK